MFAAQLAAFRYSLKSLAHRAKWGAIGGVLCVIGVIFLAVAFWIAAEIRYGALTTAFGASVIFLGAGLFALLWSRRPPRVIPRETAARMQHPTTQPALNTASLINALVMGIAAGRAVRRKD